MSMSQNIQSQLRNVSPEVLALLASMKAGDVRRQIKGALAAQIDEEKKQAKPVGQRATKVAVFQPLIAEASEPSIDNADTEICEVPEPVPTPLPTGDGFVLTHGSRDGYVELRFDEKPEQGVIKALKAAKFRFTNNVRDDNGRKVKGKRDPRWYGLAANLPPMFANALVRSAA